MTSCLLLLAGLFGDVSASQTVAVQLADGRVIHGVLDPATDAATVWLRIEQDAVVLRSGFPRDRVRSIERADAIPQTARRPTLPPLPEPLTSVEPAAVRVETLEVFAHAANWDADVEMDGVRVLVRPLDARGRVVPIDGEVALTLYGQDIRRSNVLDLQPPPFPELGRRSERIRRTDFHADGVFVQLPYAQRQPEFDLHLFPEGLLNARLGIAGQGVFDASDAWVFLRPPSVIRDQLEFRTERRFFPSERALPDFTRPTFPVPNRHDDRLAR